MVRIMFFQWMIFHLRPILSVRKIVRKGNYVTFRDGGGYIKNVKTGDKMRFVERQGVYFIKVLVKAPSPGKTSESWQPSAGLSRPRAMSLSLSLSLSLQSQSIPVRLKPVMSRYIRKCAQWACDGR